MTIRVGPYELAAAEHVAVLDRPDVRRRCANADCGAYLARDNPGPHCSPCQRRRGNEMAVSDADVLALLVPGKYVSCQRIGEMLGVSRNAVHKHIDNLRTLGHVIVAVPRRGVMLMQDGGVDPTPPASGDGPPEDASSLAPVPTDVAAAPTGPPTGPPPSAWSTCSGGEVSNVRITYADPELALLDRLIRDLEGTLPDGPGCAGYHNARIRVVAYLAARYL